MDEEPQAGLAQALVQQPSLEQVGATPQVVRQQPLAARHAEVGRQFKAPLIALSEACDAARHGRTEHLLVPLLRQRACGASHHRPAR
jgi:hypothetical protein